MANKTVYARDHELWKQFARQAELEGMSMSALLEKVMAEYLETADGPREILINLLMLNGAPRQMAEEMADKILTKDEDLLGGSSHRGACIECGGYDRHHSFCKLGQEEGE